jgi:flagellar hook-associated protein 2
MGSINLISGGLDVQGIVDNLISVERLPIQRLQTRSKTYQDKISAYQALNTKLLALKTSVESLLYKEEDIPLSLPTNFADRLSKSLLALRKATSSDETIVKATAGKGQVTGNYAITVSALATYNAYASNNFSSATETRTKIGTLSIQKGQETQVDIEITESNNTLQGIANAINDEDAGFTASILNDGSGSPYRLVIASDDSGAANELTITNGLTNDPEGQTLSAVVIAETTAAANAQLQINGVNITSSSNTVTTAVAGITFDLRSQSGSAIVSVERDTDAIVTGIKDFIAKYNDVVSYISAQSRYDAAKKSAGILAGDMTLRSAQSQIGSIPAQGIDTGGSLKVLAEAGISLTNSGTLALDETKLRDKLSANFDDTARLFLADGLDSEGRTVSMAPLLRSRLKNLTDSYQGPVSSAIDALRQNMHRIDDQVLQIEERLVSRRAVLLAQFTKADEALKQLSVLQTSLTSLMNSISNL